MKRLFPLLAIVALAPVASFAQGGGTAIKVTTTIHSDGTQTVLKTDPDGHTAESKTVDAAKNVIQRTVYAMDDQGLYTSASVFDGKDKLLFKSVYTRDASNRVNAQTDTTADDKPLRKQLFEYDGSGKLAAVRTFDPAGNETTPAKKQILGSKRGSGSKR